MRNIFAKPTMGLRSRWGHARQAELPPQTPVATSSRLATMGPRAARSPRAPYPLKLVTFAAAVIVSQYALAKPPPAPSPPAPTTTAAAPAPTSTPATPAPAPTDTAAAPA